jgi:uncharacterized ParB-like nuclease family protein
MTNGPQTIDIDLIRIDGGTQQRPLDEDALTEYTTRLVDGSKPPPVQVVFDGKDYWLWDGFHRYHAHLKAGLKRIMVMPRRGTPSDAVWLSFGANKDHGVRRQKGVLREILERILTSDQWKSTSQQKIAEHVGCSREYVNHVAAEMKKGGSIPVNSSQVSFTHARSGKPATMDVSGMTRKSPPQEEFVDEDFEGGEQRGEEDGGDGGAETAPVEARATQNYRKSKGGRGGAESGPAKKGPPPHVDEEGNAVPDALREVFDARADYDAALNLLTQLSTIVNRLAGDQANKRDAHPAGLHLAKDRAGIVDRADWIRTVVRFARPHAVCPHCHGKGCPKTSGCKGAGWFNLAQYRAAPDNLKKREVAA